LWYSVRMHPLTCKAWNVFVCRASWFAILWPSEYHGEAPCRVRCHGV
jgi:hypothetical protein